MKKLLIASLITALAAFSSTSAKAQIVTNGGFETGNFTGWTLSGNLGITDVANNAVSIHTGSFGARLGAIGPLNYISQTLSTVGGDSYQFSFWLRNSDTSQGPGPSQFTASWNGNLLLNLANPATFDWTQYIFNVSASSAATTISFGSRNDPSFFRLDDIAVTRTGGSNSAVPEPSTYGLMAAVTLMGVVALRRKRASKA